MVELRARHGAEVGGVTEGGETPGWAAARSAAAAEANGVAMEVPDFHTYELVVPHLSDEHGARMACPGAATSTQLPVVEKGARTPAEVVAATAMASGSAAG
jgi:hypothetical protein